MLLSSYLVDSFKMYYFIPSNSFSFFCFFVPSSKVIQWFSHVCVKCLLEVWHHPVLFSGGLDPWQEVLTGFYQNSTTQQQELQELTGRDEITCLMFGVTSLKLFKTLNINLKNVFIVFWKQNNNLQLSECSCYCVHPLSNHNSMFQLIQSGSTVILCDPLWSTAVCWVFVQQVAL